MVLRIQLKDAQILDRDAVLPHVARQVMAAPDAPRSRRGSDRARPAMRHRPVGLRSAFPVPPTHPALEPFPDRHADDIDQLVLFEHIDGELLANLERGVCQAKLADVAKRSGAGLLEDAESGLRQLLLIDGLKPDLHRLISVTLGLTQPDDGARPGLHRSHRPPVPELVVHMRHAKFFTEEADGHYFTST